MKPAIKKYFQTIKGKTKGFTLIELLVVIGILAILLAIVLIAINPSKQFAQANDTKRSSDVNAILNAVHQYAANNAGNLPSGITTTVAAISTTGTGVDFCNELITEYLAALPADPTVLNGTPVGEAECASYATGYTILRSATDSRITVSAPSATAGTVISVVR